MFTSSFACTPSPARVAITSLAFMFDDVPDPVWKTSIGNWSSSSPFAMRAAAAAMRSALSRSSRPSSAFTRAAAPLMRPSQRATEAGIGSPETGKFATAFVVSVPQSSCFCSVLLTARVYATALRRRDALGGVQELVPRAELHARAAELLARSALELVDRRPVAVHDETRRALREEPLDLLGGSGPSRRRPPGPRAPPHRPPRTP